jgi:hypothetical protein
LLEKTLKLSEERVTLLERAEEVKETEIREDRLQIQADPEHLPFFSF